MTYRMVAYRGMTPRGNYMHEAADIIAYKLVPEGTYLKIFIPGKNLMEPIVDKHMNRCNVWLDDGRHIPTSAERFTPQSMTYLPILGTCRRLRKNGLSIYISTGPDADIFHCLIVLWILPGNLSILYWIMRWNREYRCWISLLTVPMT